MKGLKNGRSKNSAQNCSAEKFPSTPHLGGVGGGRPPSAPGTPQKENSDLNIGGNAGREILVWWGVVGHQTPPHPSPGWGGGGGWVDPSPTTAPRKENFDPKIGVPRNTGRQGGGAPPRGFPYSPVPPPASPHPSEVTTITILRHSTANFDEKRRRPQKQVGTGGMHAKKITHREREEAGNWEQHKGTCFDMQRTILQMVFGVQQEHDCTVSKERAGDASPGFSDPFQNSN